MAYAQVELNQVAFRRDGRIEAQLPYVNASKTPAENGMILQIDYVAGKVTLPTAVAATNVYALNYSTEHIYDERTPGLENFCIEDGEYPRLGFLAKGDRFTTNAITGTVVAGDTLIPSTSGKWVKGTRVAGTPTCQVVEVTTMPNGSVGYKLVVIDA